MGWNDLNATEGVEREKVGVTGYEVGCPATYGEFEEFVVLGIAAHPDLNIHLDPLAFACQRSEKASNVLLIEVVTKLLSAQHFVEFGKYRKGKQDTVPFRSARSSAWRGFESGRSNALTNTFVSNTQRN